jgi:ribulose-phosphate 3-epimerase
MSSLKGIELLESLCPTISVGMLTANLLSLGSELSLLEQSGVRLLHVDVMDGCFCPMMTVGPPLIQAMKTPLLKDVHLMIQDPLEKLRDYVAAGADVVTVHAESCMHIHRVLQQLGSLQNANDPDRGLVRGLALNPGTPIEVVEPLLDALDLVFLLAINPGWGGQKFLTSTARRIEKLRKMAGTVQRRIFLGLDGGVTRANIVDVAKLGVDIVVTGSAVFDGKAPAENARFMLDAVRSSAPC